MSKDLKKTATGEKILDEDTYEAALDAIIQRDFFPELPELETQIQWLQAEQNNDFETLRKLTQKLKLQSYHRSIRSTPLSSSIRSPSLRTPTTSARSTRIPSVLSSPALSSSTPTPVKTSTGGIQRRTSSSSATPPSQRTRSVASTPNNMTSHNPFPGQEEFLEGEEKGGPNAEDYAKNGFLTTADGKLVNIGLSLDKFHDRHTSEDNASFSELIHTINQRNLEKYSWLKDQLLLEYKGPTAVLRLTSLEREPASTQGPEKEILHNSTRMPPPPTNLSLKALNSNKNDGIGGSATNTTTTTSGPGAAYLMLNSTEAQLLAQRKIQNEELHLDIDDVFKTPKGLGASPQVGGYSFVSPIGSPSPDQFDGSMSPLMTWGSVDGTPMLISALASNEPDVDGPIYKLQETSTREKLAHDLVEKATIKKAKTPVKFSPLRSGITKRSPLLSPTFRNLLYTRSKSSPFSSTTTRTTSSSLPKPTFSPISPHVRVRSSEKEAPISG